MDEQIVTIEKITKMVWELTGFRADATQADALQILLEDYAARQALAYKDAPTQLIESLLNSLHHQASQILDTGGRMRLSAEGQLDAKDQPIALATDVKVLDNKLGRLHSAVSELTSAMMAQNEQITDEGKKGDRRQTGLDTVLDLLGGTLQELRGDTREYTLAAQTLTKTVLEAVASRGQVDALSDQVQRMREVLSDVQQLLTDQAAMMKAATPPPAWELELLAKQDKASRISEEELAKWLREPTLVDWERQIVERELAERLTQPEVLPSAYDAPGQTWSAMTDNLTTQEIAALQEDAAAGRLPVRKINASRAAEPVRYENGHPVFPGCFFNEDGTITCRDCGVAKMPSEDKKASAYYKDRQSHTGYKASCKDCEKKAKAAKAA